MANDQNDVAPNKPDITLVPALQEQTVNSACENVLRNSSGVYAWDLSLTLVHLNSFLITRAYVFFSSQSPTPSLHAPFKKDVFNRENKNYHFLSSAEPVGEGD